MNFSMYFLIIICHSIIIGETSPLPDEEVLEEFAARNQSITGSRDGINLKLSKEGAMIINSDLVLWKGTYNGIDVAIKIVSEEQKRKELIIIEALKATENFDIKKRRIQRVYYGGPCLERYFAIAMTLHEWSLRNRMQNRKKKLSESTALLIFKQAVESLSYIHSKNVKHNNLHLGNIFIRGNDVFIGGFDESVLGGELIQDYNELMFIFWDMVDKISDESDYYKTSYLKNDIVREAMEAILDTEMIIGEFGILPNYKEIIEISDKALAEIGRSSGPVEFDWLKEGEHASSSRH